MKKSDILSIILANLLVTFIFYGLVILESDFKNSLRQHSDIFIFCGDKLQKIPKLAKITFDNGTSYLYDNIDFCL